MKILTPGTISKLLGVPRYKLYYLEERGQIPAARRSENQKRFYTTSDYRKLKKLLQRRIR